MKRAVLVAGLLVALLAARAEACCLFREDFGFPSRTPTFREEMKLGLAKVVLYGTIDNPRDVGEAGETAFHIKTVLRSDPAIKGVTKIVLPRALPIADKKSPPHYLVFVDVDGKTLDPYRGVPITGKQASVDYLTKALALKGDDVVTRLPFFFNYLEDADEQVARDAFDEFSKATDAELAKVAPKLAAAKLRGWVKSDKTPADCLRLYALLLGMCGKEADAAYLRRLLDCKAERSVNAADGALAGYIALKPKEGWALAHRIISDDKRPLPLRLAVLRVVRYYHRAKPKESREQVVKILKATLAEEEIADLAVWNLRRWQMWDLTAEVLKRYPAKGADSPMMRRRVIQYALAAPAKDKAVQAFVKARRLDEAPLVAEAEEHLQLEAEAAKPKDDKKPAKKGKRG